MRQFAVFALAGVLCLAGLACDESLSTLAGPSPNLQPTFASVQQEIFESTDIAGRVACITCHTNVGRNPTGNLNLTHDFAYDQLVNVPVAGRGAPPGSIRVIPGDPDNSYLIKKLVGAPDIVGLQMPRVGPPYMTAGQILILKRWIAIGAPRN